MQEGRSKDFVAFGAVLAAAIWGTWLFIRSEMNLGGGWTDGQAQYTSVRGERIRYAVWDTPEPFGGEVNSVSAESQPAISPDGHWLVFRVGERGLNSDLFVGELVGGEVRDARPLNLLNSAFDELAPAFGPDSLYFASDRGGPEFGLDLWRAPYADGVFSPAEPIGSGINTKADESDPRPLPGSRQLLFSSNRKRASRTDFDLYLAQPAEKSATKDSDADQALYEVTALDELNTPFDERDPALTSDGRTLIFASDRDGSLGGFDLYRSFLEADHWLPARPLQGVNSAASERGPLLSADGFSLYFDVSRDQAAADLWRAHSKELFRIPADPLSIYEILGLLALFLLAILAWLSKRWHTIDVIYRCFLISLLIHLFLMWYLREVFPEAGPVESGGTERLIRVRLAPSAAGTPATSIERAGELQITTQAVAPAPQAPARAQLENTPASAQAAPSQNQVARPERQLQAPSRRAAQLAENRSESTPAATLLDAESSQERYASQAPSLQVAAREPQTARTEHARSNPERSTPVSASSPLQNATPLAQASAPAARQDTEDRRSQAPGAKRLERKLAKSSASSAPTSIASPAESFEAASSDAPRMDMPSLTLAAAPERQAGAAERRQVHSMTNASLGQAAQPAQSQQSLTLAEPENSAWETAPRGDSLNDAQALQTSDASSVTLEERTLDALAAPMQGIAPSFEAAKNLAQVQGARSQKAALDPARKLRTDNPQAFASNGPGQQNPLQLKAQKQAESQPVEDMPSALQPDQALAQSQPQVALREMEASQAPSPVGMLKTPSFDAKRGLSLGGPQRYERSPSPTPSPAPFKASRQNFAPRPMAQPMLASAPKSNAQPDDLPKRLEHTPYQNRFGQEKLRALDEFGGGVETERAVADGLSYLSSIQNSDGSWGQASDFDRSKYRDVRVGKSALALLAFLGAGHTPTAQSEYSQVARRSVQYFLGIQDEASGHFGNSSSYGHGIATYALAECYAITKEKRLRRAIERGVQRILDKQNRRRDRRTLGGWGYYFQDDSVWDNDTWPRVSVSSWQIMALKSARNGGLSVPDDALEAAESFLAGAWDRRHKAFRYSHDPSRLNSGYPILPASTPAALFALSLLGNDISGPEMSQARRFVLQRAPRDYSYSGADDFVHRGRGNLYFWYYSTLAMFRVGGSEWSRWNAAIKTTLLESQAQNGSWRPLSSYSDYAGDDSDERTYSTAMCVLSLEVYYRYFTPLLNK